MVKLCICDIDGVVANPEKRFQAAEIAKSLYLASTDRPDMLQREATDHYWRTVFDPTLVETDTLVDEGVTEAIAAIEQHEENDDLWQIVYLTSRPESMREATLDWLTLHRLSGPKLVMKPSAFQYVKTITWKAGMVQTLAAMYRASYVLVVDDEQVNLNEIVKVAVIPPQVPGLMIAKSLAEAVAKLNGTWVEPEAFLPEE